MVFITQILLQTPVNPQSLRDIKPPLEITENLLSYYFIGVFLLVIVGGVIWLYQKKRNYRKPSTIVDEVIPRPPHEIALEKLRMLESSSYDMFTFHKRISYVIREYIALRFQIPALELTTTGIVQWMNRKQIDDSIIERTHEFFINCDHVKFARHQPKSTEAETRMVDAMRFINETK